MSEKPKLTQIYADQETKALLEALAEKEDRTLLAQLRVIVREAAERLQLVNAPKSEACESATA
ncbi:hypothetical protein LLG95_12925 [bacterium]|nr:hypothetical protein [bacterium]